ncbi:CRISPR-associated endonuclease Cas1 [Metallosphaera tengchongensis]|uniref:CRISPR-associated endonuclease Cas1 n=1 Tax=Metallosphaera tengchongensis TaxID=1532350 RepID=A0A6N0P084_9CREN|nr:CRISPR-associated endonuclease Cas1 [Metallosphaera tengchongensis]QKR00761.1 CRISPR-associated endonuclease Cas1 [Metallosphaera tengchongensis]
MGEQGDGKKLAFVKDYGAYLRVNKGMIVCEVKGRQIWSVSPAELSSIVVIATSSISSEVVKLAYEYGVDLVFFDRYEPIAKLIPGKYGGSMKLWMKQVLATRRKYEYAREFVYAKLHNQYMTLRYYERKYGYELSSRELDELSRSVLNLTDVREIMGREAEGAKAYWRGVVRLLPKSLGFRGRKRTAQGQDPFNVALNIGYAMLRKVVYSAVVSVGLNPYVGFLHSPRGGKTSLVFDLMEEFRSPEVDRKLIGMAREKEEDVKDKKRVYSLGIEEDLVYTQARRLANSILRGEEYRPYLSK